MTTFIVIFIIVFFIFILYGNKKPAKQDVKYHTKGNNSAYPSEKEIKVTNNKISTSLIEKEFKAVAKLCKHSVNGYYSSDEVVIINSFYSYIFRCCENAVREYYKHRKLSMEFSYYNDNIKKKLNDKIFIKVNLVISELLCTVQKLTEEVEIQLCEQNTGRWKHYYKDIKRNYNHDN